MPIDEAYTLKVGNTEPNGFDFRIAVSVYEMKNPNASMEDLAAFGTLEILNTVISTDTETGFFNITKTPLSTHYCND